MSTGELVYDDTRNVWVILTTSDLTEGKSFNYPKTICECLSTARRLGKGKYIQGCNCPIEQKKFIK